MEYNEKWRELGALLRTARKRLKLSLHAVAASVGMSPSYLSRIERGERRPPAPEVLRRLAPVLQLDTNVVLEAAGYRDLTNVAELPHPYGMHPEEWRLAIAVLTPEDWEDVEALIRTKVGRHLRRPKP
ncbi:MAG: helix-turn-helix domain-containing protein [Firmicutes bacterium]|nr:helix-turn-helix domain-containing protein [Bacillota bacterium]